ncbi:EF-TsMt 1 [Cytidiella melzeri]|nr:EF-TsMt 1 [Cytidiella melzeri]
MGEREAKPSSRLKSQTRQGPPCSLVEPSLLSLRVASTLQARQAREALAATNNDVQAAYKWLQDDLVASGAKKAAKLGDRVTQQGLVGVSILSNSDGKGKFGRGVRAAMVEVNCETDFVGRNARFDALVADIAHTAAFIAEAEDSSNFLKPVPLELLQDAPLISREGSQSETQGTVGSVIHDSIARFGERIQLRRAVSVVHTPSVSNIRLRVATYSHGSVGMTTQGSIGTLAVLALRSSKLDELFGSPEFTEGLAKLERSLARQIVGFPTTRIRTSTGEKEEGALYDQEFMMYPSSNGETVSRVLQQWSQERGLQDSKDAHAGLEVIEFMKWTVGESEISA